MEELKKEPVTVFLILVNALVFLVVEFTGGSEDTLHMLQCGAAYTPSILDGEYFRIFTCMFLHFGAKHLGNNMLSLIFLGDILEQIVGKWKYLIIYMGGGLLGNLLSMVLEIRTGDYAISAGASGAVFAVIGALLYIVFQNRVRLGETFGKRMAFMAVLMLFQGFTSAGVDNGAHVGGMLG